MHKVGQDVTRTSRKQPNNWHYGKVELIKLTSTPLRLSLASISDSPGLEPVNGGLDCSTSTHPPQTHVNILRAFCCRLWRKYIFNVLFMPISKSFPVCLICNGLGVPSSVYFLHVPAIDSGFKATLYRRKQVDSKMGPNLVR